MTIEQKKKPDSRLCKVCPVWCLVNLCHVYIGEVCVRACVCVCMCRCVIMCVQPKMECIC